MDKIGKFLIVLLFLGFGIGTVFFLLDINREETPPETRRESIYCTPEETVRREWDELRSLTGIKLREKMRRENIVMNLQNSYAEQFMNQLADTVREERKYSKMEILGSRKNPNGRDADVRIRLTWRDEPPEDITISLRLNEETGAWQFGKFCFWDKLEQNSHRPSVHKEKLPPKEQRP